MERFKVSGQELRDFYKTETQLGRVFSDIERDLKSVNQVVCQFIVNGLELRDSEEARFVGISLTEVETLEYLTEGTEILIESVLDSWIDALPELIMHTEQLAQHIRTAGLVGSYKAIHDLVENCEYLVGSMVSLKSLKGEAGTKASRAWENAEQASHIAVKQAITALETKDFVQLADILEYDLNHALQSWHESLVQLGEVFEICEDGQPASTAQTRSHLGGRGRLAN